MSSVSLLNHYVTKYHLTLLYTVTQSDEARKEGEQDEVDVDDARATAAFARTRHRDVLGALYHPAIPLDQHLVLQLCPHLSANPGVVVVQPLFL